MAETTRKYKANRETFGTIRQRSNGRFQASYLHEGTRYYGPTTYSTRTDARAWLTSVHTDIARGKWRSPKSVVAEVFDAYARTWVEQRVSGKGQPLRPKTKAEYVRQLGAGLSTFSKDSLTAITQARVRAWHHKRTAEAGATMAGAEARLLKAILSTAVVDRIIETNPVPSVLTRTTTGKAHRVPTATEVAVLAANVDDRFGLAVLIAAFGGLRISEWRGLRRQDLTLVEGRYLVAVTRQVQHVQGVGWVVGPPKSAAGVRTISLPSHLTDTVTEHLNMFVGKLPDSLLFTPPNAPASYLSDGTFRQSWDRAREAAGVVGVVREHDLRAFALTNFAVRGATLAEIQKFGGHSTAVAAMAYQHAAADRLAELSDALPPLPPVPVRETTNVIPITG